MRELMLRLLKRAWKFGKEQTVVGLPWDHSVCVVPLKELHPGKTSI